MYYLRIWARLAAMNVMRQLSTRLASAGYLFGKIARLLLFLLFMLAIFEHSETLAGYTLNEMVIFFVTFTIIDSLADFLFRGVYAVRAIVADGDLDLYLTQPVPPLFRIAVSGTDFLDALSLVPALAVLAVALDRQGVAASQLAVYALLLVNGLAIGLAIHVAVAAVAVWTQEMESTIWIYHELMTLGRFPADIYARPVRALLTFAVPVAVMVSYPVEGLLGTLKVARAALALAVSIGALALSALVWRTALAKYTSVSA